MTAPEPASSARRLSAEQRASLVDDTVDMLVVIDARGCLVHANEPAARRLGWGPGEPPVEVATFIHPDDRAEMALALERFVHGTTPMRRKRLRVRGGSEPWIWVEILSRNRLGVPGIDGIVITARDVTDQVFAERQLVESEQRFRSIVTASSDAVMMLRPDGTVTYSSPRAEELLRQSGGSDSELLSIVHPEDRSAAGDCVARAAGDPVGSKHHVTVRIGSSGGWRWFDAWVVNQLGVAGVDALVVYGRDVTAQRSAEEALRARVEVDELLARISSRFIDAGTDEIDAAVAESLAELGSYCGADRAWIFQLHPDRRHIDHTYEWCATGVSSEIDRLKGLAIEDLPGFSGWIGNSAPLLIGSVAAMGPELGREREILAEQGIRSLAAQAMFVRGDLYGLIGLDVVREEVRWSDHVVWALDASAGIFGSALRRCEAESALALNEARFRAMFEQASDGVRVVDVEFRTVYASPAVERITGYSTSEMEDPGVRLLLVHPDDREGIEAARDELRRRPGETIVSTFRMLRPEGNWIHVEESSTNLVHDPAVRGYVVNMRDVTERHRHEQELVAQARRDTLTGLPNRLLFEELLDAALARSALSGTRLAVLALDLDRFKLVNESLGHRTGDLLLEAVAARLRGLVRGGDVVARVGSDEFVLLCEPISGSEVPGLAEAIVEAFQGAFHVDGHGVYSTASVGVAVSELGGGVERTTLMQRADAALAAAKRDGGDRAVVFSGDLGDAARERLDIEAGLRAALTNDELRLHYQPIVDLGTGAVVGVEALLRWEHPSKGLLLPAAFLDVAEETGLIGPIGAWVIGSACRQQAVWRQNGLTAGLSMHLNVSVRQLNDGGVAETLRAALAATSTDPPRFCVEITESALLAGADALAELEAARATGVRVGLDDFGTGHSSLAYLRNLPIDVVKIDRAFVDGVTEEASSDAAIVAAIVSLATSLGLRTVGEGVETAAQAEALRRLGCDQVQGFWYSRPVPPEDVERFIAAQNAARRPG